MLEAVSVPAAGQKRDHPLTMDRPLRFVTDVGDIAVDDRGGHLGRRKFAGICDWLREVVLGESAGGKDRCNSDGHDHNSSKYRKPPHRLRRYTIAVEKHGYALLSSAPDRGLDKRVGIMRR